MAENLITDLSNKIVEASAELSRHGIYDQLSVDEACALVAEQATPEKASKTAMEILKQYQAALDKHNTHGHLVLSVIGVIFLGLSMGLLLVSWQLALLPLPLFLYLLWPQFSPDAPSRHAGVRTWNKIQRLFGYSG